MKKNVAKIAFILIAVGVRRVFNLETNSLLAGLLIGGVFTYIMLFLAMEDDEGRKK